MGQTTDRAPGSHPHIPTLKIIPQPHLHLQTLPFPPLLPCLCVRLQPPHNFHVCFPRPLAPPLPPSPLPTLRLPPWLLAIFPAPFLVFVCSPPLYLQLPLLLYPPLIFRLPRLEPPHPLLPPHPFPLPPLLPYSFELLLFVSTPSSGYRILVHSSCSTLTFLYDSCSLSWRRFDSFNLKLAGNCPGEGVYFGGKSYFATSDRFPITRFDPQSGDVERCGGVGSGNELTFCRLVSDGDKRLFLMGGVGTNGILRGMKVRVLGEGSRGWIEMESVPELICRKLMSVSYHYYEHVYCLWHQWMSCICCDTWPEVLYYRESRRTWHWLPKFPYLPEKWSCGFRWDSFLPEISACV